MGQPVDRGGGGDPAQGGGFVELVVDCEGACCEAGRVG